MNILVTGCAGFIGYHLIMKLLKDKTNIIIGIDNMNNYYDVTLKKYRLQQIENHSNFIFEFGNITDSFFINSIFTHYKIDIIVHLAAQAGVRHSMENPHTYICNNIDGFVNILEACKNYNINHLIYASSSSVYGNDNNPISVYAVTKKTDELLAYCYNNIYNISITGIRFFTVYGPAGRPDMFFFKFVNNILKREEIPIYNYGNNMRDFTYVDDVVKGIISVINNPPIKPEHNIIHISLDKLVILSDAIEILETELIDQKLVPKDFDFELYKKYLPIQPADMVSSCNSNIFEKDFQIMAEIELQEGLKRFVSWYKEYYSE